MNDQLNNQLPQGQSTKLLIAASGTGGHLFPAIAVAEQLQLPIEWLGVPDRLETELIPQHYPLHTVRMGGVQGKLGLGSLKLLWQFLQATLATRRLLRRGKFQAVLTTGGYIAAPAIVAARSLGLPAVLHESNALPGKVTRWLSRWCSVVALGFKDARTRLPKQAHTQWAGTPVRTQFFTDRQADLKELAIPPDVPVVVVVGGSQGALAVNRIVREAAPDLLAAGVWLIHQTGNSDPDTELLSHAHYIHRPFFNNIAALFQRASLVVSRAGAGTLTELAITHTPAILIPYPFAADDHQTYNANAFSQTGAALVYRQSELSGHQLKTQILDLLAQPDRLAAMATAAGSLSTPDSAQQVAQLLLSQLQ